MKAIILIPTFFFILYINSANAIPINTSAGVNLSNSLIIASGGELPLGLEVRSLNPIVLELSQNSILNAPDTVPFEDSITVIDGQGPSTPSRFYKINSSTRNGGSEGALASNNHRLYQIREGETDGSSDVSERGVWGESISQAALTTEFHEASANANVLNERQFSISNQNATAITFGIQGIFEMNMFALASGINTFAESVATAGFWFTSSGMLDIQFADLESYIFNEERTGLNTTASIKRETDVANAGYMSMTGITRSFNDGANSGDALASSKMAYVLGITLQPGEEITMLHSMSYSTRVAIAVKTFDVAAPANMTLLYIITLFGFGFVAKSRIIGE